MAFSQRRLPHWQPDQRPLFITFRLHGSLPLHRVVTPAHLTSGEAFVWVDRLLDRAISGPLWLRRPDIAQMVVSALEFLAQRGDYSLLAYVVMSNHVHFLIFPHKPLPAIMHSLKTYTARQANLALGRRGEPFWQHESYDHWVRDEQELGRIQRYIESNPVKAGLVRQPAEWLWSSAYKQAKEPACT